MRLMRLHYTCWCWLAGLLWLCWATPLRAESLMFEHLLTADDDAASNIGAVIAITQDKRGYIWLGGSTGLARFDGHTMRFYRKGDLGLVSDRIYCLLPDATGDIWVGTSQGLHLYRLAEDRFDRISDPANQTPDAREINTLALDSQQNLWIGTNNGLTRLAADRQHFRHFAGNSDSNEGLGSNALRKILIDSRQRMWLATMDGLYLARHFPLQDEPLEVISWRDGTGPQDLTDDAVLDVAEDLQGRIWIGTYNAGVNRLSADLKRIDRFVQEAGNPNSLPGKITRSIVRDLKGQMWLALEGGLVRYNEASNDFTRFRHSDSNPQSLSNDALMRIFIDRDGDFWLGALQGVNYLNRATSVFTNYRRIAGRKNSLSHNAVMALMEDSDGELWVGTESGLNRFDVTRKTITRYRKNTADPNALQVDPILCLAQDRAALASGGDIWIGTWSGGLYRFNKKSGKFHHYGASNKPGSLGSNYIWSLAFDRQHRLWVATQTAGLHLYDAASDTFERWSPDPQNPNAPDHINTRNLLADTDGHSWIAGNSDGLRRLNFASKTFELFTPKPDANSIPSVSITKLMLHSNGDVWIGTQDAGVAIWHRRDQQFSRITQQQGLVSDAVVSLVEDAYGDVWVSTLNGVSRVKGFATEGATNPDAVVARLKIKNFSKQQGLASNNYNRDASLKDRQGNIYLGGTEGFSVFNPRAIIENTIPPKLVLTQLRINNKAQSFDPNTALILPHDQNTLEFDFSAMSFRAARSNTYQYRLDGFDSAWSAPSPRYHLNYNHLPPGHYRFRVTGANADGVSSQQELTVSFHIAPPPWRSHWAYASYILGAITLLLLISLWQARRLELKSERHLNDELRQLNKMKDAFLANTSHELRTPLNGIIGLTESLVSGDSGAHNGPTRQALEVMLKSGRRMAQLVNDILDFAKLNERKLTLHKTALDLHTEAATAITLLSPLAQAKHLHLHNHIPASLPRIIADPDRLQQILLNLLGNAIKFTEQGEIYLETHNAQGHCWIQVRDTGIGIAPGDLDIIFNAFRQVADSDTRSQGGSGLGLTICQQLVALHGGEIQASSQLGRGTTIRFGCRSSEYWWVAWGGRGGPRWVERGRLGGTA